MQDERICQEVRNLAVTPSKDLSLSQYEHLQQHLVACDDCANAQRKYEALRMRIHSAVAQEPVPDISISQIFEGATDARFQRPAESLPRRTFIIEGLVAALTVLGGGAALLALSHVLHSPSQSGGANPTPSSPGKCASSSPIGSIPSDGLLTAGVLLWGADANGDGAPYVFPDANGDPIGFEVDIAQAIANLMGITPQFQQTSYEKLDDPLQSRQIDIILNGWEITPEHLKDESFSDPYYRYSQQLVVRANDPRFSHQGANSLITLTDLKAYKFGTGKGYKAADLLRGVGITPSEFDNPLDDLNNRAVDIVMVDTPIVAYYVLGKGKRATPSQTLRPIGQPLFTDSTSNYVIGFKKNDPYANTLLNEINQTLKILKRDGTLKRIYQQWGLWNDFQKDIGIVDCS